MWYTYLAPVEILLPLPQAQPVVSSAREQVLVDAQTGQVVYLLTRPLRRGWGGVTGSWDALAEPA